MTRALIKWLAPLAVIVVSASIGLSIARASPSTEEAAWVLTLGGALAGAIAVGLIYVFRSDRPRPVPLIDPRKLKGVRIMVIGLVVALAGWLMAVFVSFGLGYVLAAIGILTGIFGLVIHVVLLLSAE